ncbi:MAG: hypothetical protein LBM05_00010 [Endomicrobium sp.]|jgi:4-amino-4-deoxy-L-arabinose transferase-like glycosyltransferase|nr:hypothetical protein [Endomicrobium sp.]
MEKVLEKKKTFIIIFLFAVAVAVRFAFLSEVPLGLNQDEASAGYDAWSILNFGIDRNGYKLPLYLFAWGSGQSALYAYLSIPFIAVLGLNVFSIRIVQALVSIATLIVFYKLVKRIEEYDTKESASNFKYFPFVALFIFVICPWHIMLSHFALDANLFTAFFLFAVYTLLYSIDKKRIFFYLAIVLFGISLYAYAISYIVVPIFLSISCLILLKNRKIKIKQILIAVGIFLIIAAPLVIMNLNNMGILQNVKLPLFSVPQFSSYRGGEVAFSNIKSGISSIINLIFLQKEQLLYNAIPEYGTLYKCSFIFLILGLIYAFHRLIKNIKNVNMTVNTVMCIWFIVAFFSSSLINKLNTYRINIIFIPCIYFIALGIVWSAKNIKVILTILLIYGVLFISFTSSYFTEYNTRKNLKYYFFNGIVEAVQYAEKMPSDTIYVTNSINQPYIFVLFATKENPQNFINTVEIVREDVAFQQIKSLGRYKFGYSLNSIDYDSVYIIDKDPISRFSKAKWNRKEFNDYVVMSPK